MPIDPLNDAIRPYLSAAWTDTPIMWPNEAKDRPVDTDGSLLPFLIVEDSSATLSQESIGAAQGENRWDKEGVLDVHIFVAAGTGTALANSYAGAIEGLFRERTLASGSLEFHDKIQRLRGEPGDDAGAYYRVTLYIPWRLTVA
jgi:hypothetical protein